MRTSALPKGPLRGFARGPPFPWAPSMGPVPVGPWHRPRQHPVVRVPVGPNRGPRHEIIAGPKRDARNAPRGPRVAPGLGAARSRIGAASGGGNKAITG